MRMRILVTAATLSLLQACGGGDDDTAPAPAAAPYKTLSGAAPLVIGHRGASGELPEHTLAAYERAIARGADFIEPDLVLTKDGVMIARHEPMLDDTTDVATRFDASRKTTKLVDGVSTTAYFASDFTLAEIKTLRAKQSRAGRSTAYDGLYEIPTLAEVIALAQTEGAKVGRSVGIYPEIKHSTFHKGLFGANVFEDKLVATLHPIYGNTATAPVFIQSFEVSNLQYLNTKTNIRLVQLIDADDVKDDGSMSLVAPYRQPYDFVVSGDTRLFSDLLTSTGLDFVKTYADAVGPWKPYLVKTVNDQVDHNGDGKITINDRRVDGSTGVIEMAHAKGLMVHTWTFRDDASGYGFADPKAEMQYYMKLGIDGVFTDFPAAGVAALKGL
ncbi:glycerophosphoryl diester phosphodiesterase [Sphaerotilus natans subsp. natans DSM 6575]|uniref:glycerophosphodiester phosphodiesterase n=1 Tax=Sphaerotilus natans subsp. natans DSM 6575 TaxID=1286631 RepID=A0A059KKL5_9BURK|nr:glycerophosphodiester phosphodiesterase [Sphaerotilus natans]KDB51915.1 glycerophosphoryl diester phosphodiesterase [Sphaerotilus natans subsp. natans DSM 6575]SIR35472.1 glycerophosphoryl diester phosphodiesterase [Sphaerotilus natans]